VFIEFSVKRIDVAKLLQGTKEREEARFALRNSFREHLSADWHEIEDWAKDLEARYEGPFEYRPGEVFWDMDDTRSDHYFVLDGLVAEVWRSSNDESFIYAFVGGGEYCTNEFQYLFGEPSQSRFEVIQPTRVLILRQEEEVRFRTASSPWEQLSFKVGRSILKKRRERLRLLSGDRETHLRRTFDKYPGALTWVTKEQLASYLGVSRATVYRILDRLGLIGSKETV
jgi:CRP-like cAMP-binding protein